MEFSEKIRMLRKETGLSQTTVASEMGLSVRGYQDLELGKMPRYETMRCVADYYDVSVDWLMGRTENRNAHKS